MRRDDALYLAHMLLMARKAADKAAAVSHAEFLADENLQFALLHLIQVIGEAAAQVSPEERARYPAIPWRQVIGMRHHVVHDYLAVDLEIVWDVASAQLEPLIAALQAIVPA